MNKILIFIGLSMVHFFAYTMDIVPKDTLLAKYLKEKGKTWDDIFAEFSEPKQEKVTNTFNVRVQPQQQNNQNIFYENYLDLTKEQIENFLNSGRDIQPNNNVSDQLGQSFFTQEENETVLLDSRYTVLNNNLLDELRKLNSYTNSVKKKRTSSILKISPELCTHANIELISFDKFIKFPLVDLLKNNSWICMMEKCSYTTCFERKGNFFYHLTNHWKSVKKFSCSDHEGCTEKFDGLRQWAAHYRKFLKSSSL